MENKRVMIKGGVPDFYKGRVGTVTKETAIVGIKVLWVEVGNYEMAIREDNVMYI